MKHLTSLILVFCLLFSLCACGSNSQPIDAATDSPAEPSKSVETTEATEETKDRILRNCSNAPYNAFNTRYNPSEITTITFLDKVDLIVGIPGIGVSQDNDHSVFACVIEDGKDKHLYLYGQGGIQGPEDCSHLFAEYVNLKAINFGNCFDTSNVVNMAGMFMNCRSLEAVDLSCFDTSAVQDMSRMFSGCSSLIEVNLSSFDTSNVQFMNQMFYGADALSNVDIPHLDTGRLVEATDFMSINSTLNGRSWKSVFNINDPTPPLHDGTVFIQKPDDLINSIITQLKTQFMIHYEIAHTEINDDNSIDYFLSPSEQETQNAPILEMVLFLNEDAKTVRSISLVCSCTEEEQTDCINILFRIYAVLLGMDGPEYSSTSFPVSVEEALIGKGYAWIVSRDNLKFTIIFFEKGLSVSYAPEIPPVS